jgi:formate hydrogenlyase transcriptional activator
VQNPDALLELFFSQSLDGFFFMMLDEPVQWDDTTDKIKALDYVFEHQRITKVNDAMLAQYRTTREQFLGRRPKDLFQHDLEYGRRVWRDFLDRGRLHLETDERRSDGSQMWIEGDYICFYDVAGRITGHFGIQRDVTDRKQAEVALQSQNVYLQEELKAERSFGSIVGGAPAMRQVFANVNMVAGTDSTVLILGETGTGKELIARAIHTTSKRRRAVMVKVNCAALPAALAESELFGHERGAFTGAVSAKKGRFELAHRGTIFLDEVGELTSEVQVKLLRVLQEQELERIGGTETIKVDVRVIAATNRDLRAEVEAGRFRADLFYRLNIFPIEVPPLRDRVEDVPLLAEHFVREFARKIGKPALTLGEAALTRLTSYGWPGNVRELANVLERAVILCQRGVILEEHLAIVAARPDAARDRFLTLEEMERRYICQALEQCDGVLAGPRGAARLLGMSRSTLWSRMRKLGIDAKPR